MKAAVIGGSLGGLMSTIALRGIGVDVDVFERADRRLRSRGAGIRVNALMAALLRDKANIDIGEVCTSTDTIKYLGSNNEIVYQESERGLFSTWGGLYDLLISAVENEKYFPGMACVGLTRHDDRVELLFGDGGVRVYDLAVFADGISSTGRRLLAPQASVKYAGYVAWRGTVREDCLSCRSRELLSNSFVYAMVPNSQILMFPVLDRDDDHRVHRYVNFVWYRNIAPAERFEEFITDATGVRHPISMPPGLIQQRFVDGLRTDAERILPSIAAEIVVSAQRPFVQAIYDIRVPRMVFDRACLVGDASYVARPHIGAGTAKAAVNAWFLAHCLAEQIDNVPQALMKWERSEMDMGAQLVEWSRTIGQRSQFDSNWDMRDPDLRFGLQRPGRPASMSVETLTSNLSAGFRHLQ